MNKYLKKQKEEEITTQYNGDCNRTEIDFVKGLKEYETNVECIDNKVWKKTVAESKMGLYLF